MDVADLCAVATADPTALAPVASSRGVGPADAQLLTHRADAGEARAAWRLLKAELADTRTRALARVRVLTERARGAVVALAAVQVVARIAGLKYAVRTPRSRQTGAAIGRAHLPTPTRRVAASAAVRAGG